MYNFSAVFCRNSQRLWFSHSQPRMSHRAGVLEIWTGTYSAKANTQMGRRIYALRDPKIIFFLGRGHCPYQPHTLDACGGSILASCAFGARPTPKPESWIWLCSCNELPWIRLSVSPAVRPSHEGLQHVVERSTWIKTTHVVRLIALSHANNAGCQEMLLEVRTNPTRRIFKILNPSGRQKETEIYYFLDPQLIYR